MSEPFAVTMTSQKKNEFSKICWKEMQVSLSSLVGHFKGEEYCLLSVQLHLQCLELCMPSS